MAAALLAPQLRADTTTWRIGLVNQSQSEFTGSTIPSTYTISNTWASMTTWPTWTGYSPESKGFDCSISYTLGSVPQYGCNFVLQTLCASWHVPEVAVFSNGNPVGIIQIGGLNFAGALTGTHAANIGFPYKVYIPKEFLVSGTNVLRIEKIGHPYGGTTTDYNWLGFIFDYMELDALSAPATEPLHGRVSYLGVQRDGFDITTTQTAFDPFWLQWVGVAYSGNPQRAGFFRNVSYLQPDRLNWLKMLKSLNMRVVMDDFTLTTDSDVSGGVLIPADQTSISNFWGLYGSYFEFYELSNEPCQSFSNESFAAMKAIANYINSPSIRPSWGGKVTAPGYAYGGNSGSPTNWDANTADRQNLEYNVSQCQASGGHSYAGSYYQATGGNLGETNATYVGSHPLMLTGFPVPMVVTEFGMNTGQAGTYPNGNDAGVSFSALSLDSSNCNASVFDRQLRAFLALSDYNICYVAFNSGDFNLLSGTLSDTSTWTANPWKTQPDTYRLDIFRQYALAYATHGAPLPYTYVNVDGTNGANGQLVYFRAVDTSKLPPLPVSGATSNQILLNFVNFDRIPHTMQVQVTMPAAGSYSGERIGPDHTYSAAVSSATLTAYPTVTLTETLQARQSVQYILTAGAGQVEPAGLVGYWPFSEGSGTTTIDTSGNGENGALYNTLWTTSGLLGDALNYNGTNSYVDLGNASSTGPLKPALPVTVSAWIELTGSHQSATIFNADRGDSGKYAGYNLGMSSGTLSCGYGDAMGGGTSTYRRTKIGTTLLTAGQWYHVAAVIQGATNMNLYVNGVDDGGNYSGSGGSMGYSTTSSKIGGGNGNSGTGFVNGTIDEVQVYNIALSATAVAALAANGPLAGPASLAVTPGNNQIALTWDTIPATTNYEIQRSTTSTSGPWSYVTYSATPTLKDTGLTGGTTYYYQVASISNQGLTNFSASVSATPYASYPQWIYSWFGANPPADQAAETATPADDGITNLMKYALGMNPTIASSGTSVQLPAVATTTSGSNGYLSLTFTGAATDVIYTVEATSNLNNSWSTLMTWPQGNPPGTVTVSDTSPILSTPRRFIRLDVTGQ
jgi:hypothetical protein